MSDRQNIKIMCDSDYQSESIQIRFLQYGINYSNIDNKVPWSTFRHYLIIWYCVLDKLTISWASEDDFNNYCQGEQYHALDLLAMDDDEFEQTIQLITKEDITNCVKYKQSNLNPLAVRFSNMQHQIGKFDLMPTKLSSNPDMHALLLLNQIHHSLEYCTQHLFTQINGDEISLNVPVDSFRYSDDDILQLVRCGVTFNPIANKLVLQCYN